MGRNGQANTKAKDLQLKRAAETIAKLKTQLQETQISMQVRRGWIVKESEAHIPMRYLDRCFWGKEQV